VSTETLSHQHDTDFPRTWSFDEDGDVVAGTFVELGEAPTANGYRPILTLDVAGEARTIWLFWESLTSKFREEVERRPDGDLEPGERITIERGDWKESGAGRRYRAFSVKFPDRPRRSARDILGATRTAPDDEATTTPEASGDDIPF